MYTTDYDSTLILPQGAIRSPARIPNHPVSMAYMQYQMIGPAPYRHTSDDVLTRIHARRIGIAEAEYPDYRLYFLSRPQPCLRSSPLVTLYGWAIHSDEQCRVALVNPDSDRFADLTGDPMQTKTSARALSVV